MSSSPRSSRAAPAIAVENARVHAVRTHIATTLQRSLLPPRLPSVPGLTVAARFRAAGETSEVGGDFYDLSRSASAGWSSMGDVAGKGPEAAAITSLARYTMRTAAMYERVAGAMLAAPQRGARRRSRAAPAVHRGVRADRAAPPTARSR